MCIKDIKNPEENVSQRPKEGNEVYPKNNPIFAKDLSKLICYRCKDSGHYSSECQERKPRTHEAHVVTVKPRDLSGVICFRCNEVGHFARNCPNEKKACAE
jgi:hypothetical protein